MIKRWKAYHDTSVICNCGIDLDDNGALVHYSDHLKIVAEKDAEISGYKEAAIEGDAEIESLRTKITDLEIDADSFPTLAEFSNLQDENGSLRKALGAIKFCSSVVHANQIAEEALKEDA